MPLRDGSLFDLLREDRRSQREGWLAQGFWALLVYRISNRRLSMRPSLGRKLLGGLSLLGGKYIEVVTGISLPGAATIGRRLRIEHFGGIIVHSAAVIGDDCQIRQGVTLGNRTEARHAEAPVIGNRVSIGVNAAVLGAVRIGDDATVGAHTLVLSDVPAGATVVGNPARVLTASRERKPTSSD